MADSMIIMADARPLKKALSELKANLDVFKASPKLLDRLVDLFSDGALVEFDGASTSRAGFALVAKPSKRMLKLLAVVRIFQLAHRGPPIVDGDSSTIAPAVGFSKKRRKGS
jgi:hypothetical protein